MKPCQISGFGLFSRSVSRNAVLCSILEEHALVWHRAVNIPSMVLASRVTFSTPSASRIGRALGWANGRRAILSPCMVWAGWGVAGKSSGRSAPAVLALGSQAAHSVRKRKVLPSPRCLRRLWFLDASHGRSRGCSDRHV